MVHSFPHRLFLFCLVGLLTFTLMVVFNNHKVLQYPVESKINKRNVEFKYKKVPVELFVMSKCPDAVFCEAAFSNVIREIGEIVDLDINFIGQVNDTKQYGVECMHGDSECLGNIQELCAKEVAPKTWYSFILCLNKQSQDIGVDEKLTEQCLKFSSINKKAFNKCVNNNGKKMLQRNMRRSINLELKKSCTIIIDKGVYKCIHDGEWKECTDGYRTEDFVKQICESYHGPTPPRCKKYYD